MSENGINRLAISALNIFCLGYWFIWNHSFGVLPRLAIPMAWLCNKLSAVTGINLQLRSDSMGQLLAIFLLLLVCIGMSKFKGINYTAGLWNWSPYVLVSGQLWLYGAVKLAGVQFIPIPHISENPSEELEFWRMAGNMGTPVIIAGCVQIAIAIGLWIPNIRHWAAWASMICFIIIMGLNLYFGISVKVHTAILYTASMLMAGMQVKFQQVTRTEATLLSVILAGLLAEGVYYFL